MKQTLAALAILLALAGPAFAGPFEDGVAALQRGDHEGAVLLWRPLAEQGDVYARFNLGIMYAKGEGVSQDAEEALRWFRLAADQGYARAQFNLSLAYGFGKGVPQNKVRAHMWSGLAAARGHKKAIEVRDVLAKHMTPAEISEAQRLAREWEPKSE